MTDAAQRPFYRFLGVRVVEGLRPDDRVIVGGLQQVRPRLQVRPDEVPMPTFGSQRSGAR